MAGLGPLSITELSAQTGVSVRTVRYYQTQALIPPPRRVGREARYDESHVVALRLVAELQDRGLRLSTIRQVLDRARHEPEALNALLGLDASLSRPWTVDPPALCTREEMQARLGDRDVSIELLVAHGLVEVRDDTRPRTYLVPSTKLLDLCLDLVGLGVSAEVTLQAHRMLRDQLGGLADDLVRHITEDVSIERRANEGVDALAAFVDAVRPIAHTAVSVAFSHEMERALREIARLISALREADAARDGDSRVVLSLETPEARTSSTS